MDNASQIVASAKIKRGALICGNFGGEPIAASPEHMLAE
jgi:hypothetical protein